MLYSSLWKALSVQGAVKLKVLTKIKCEVSVEGRHGE